MWGSMVLVYDLIEFIIERTNSYINLSKHLNSIFKKHGVGYTIINGCITPISMITKLKVFRTQLIMALIHRVAISKGRYN